MGIIISKKQAREFVFDCFDTIIQDIKGRSEKQKENKIENDLTNGNDKEASI